MQTLPFQKVREIEQALLRQCELEDLVAVFSQNDSDQCLLVYNTDDALPTPPHPAWQTQRLHDLPHAEYTRFDGPVIGLSAVDVILPGVPTHGVHFYPIERVFRQTNQHLALHRTTYRLARTIYRHLHQLQGAELERKRYRGCSKIIQLALPFLLISNDHPLDNLVAVVPSADLHKFLDPEQQGHHFIYNDPSSDHDVQHLEHYVQSGQGAWVAALDETSLFLAPKTNFQQLVDLRIILRQIEQEDLLEQICRDFALRCWHEWETTGEPAFCRAAYSLATESWLVDEDVEGMVALFPNKDFARFAHTGDALRIYRALEPTDSRLPSSSGPRYSMEDLLLGTISHTDYRTSPLSFPVLAGILKRISEADLIDLGPTLWKANHTVALAHIFWLLSRDLIERPIPEWVQIGAEPSSITDLARRAILIYSLNDPWQWRGGRYSLFLRDCYRHLDHCLQDQSLADEDMKYYYNALRDWYACSNADDDELRLTTMVQSCRNFQDSSYERNDEPELYKTTQRLLEIGSSILQPDHNRQFSYQGDMVTEWKSEEIAAFLQTIAESTTPISEPSPIMGQFLQIYFDIHDRWHRLQEKTFVERPSPAELDALLAEFISWQRVIHAPAHEMVVLRRAHSRDIDHILRLKQSMGSGAIIKVGLQNPWITLDAQETLLVTVQNIGSEGATQFKLELDRSREFVFLSEGAPFEVPTFAPGERYRLEYRVRIKEPMVNLIFSYRYRDNSGQLQTDQERVRVEARQRQADVRSFTRANPFEVGRPVSGADHFFGRRKELHKILSRLARGSTQPLVLRGPRRIGKSSLLRQLTRVLTDRRERQALDLSTEMQSQISTIHPILTDMQSIDQNVSGYFQRFMSVILKDICTRLSLEEETTRQIIATFRHQSPEDGTPKAFMDQMSVILEQRPHERLVILIDELDEVFRDEYEAIARNLRHIIQEEKRISWITTSTMIVRGYSAYGSPWFNLLEPLEMSKMDWESATRLITIPSEKIGLDWQVEAVAAVLEQAGQRPYLIQMLCARIIDHLNQKGLDSVDVSTVWEVINQMIEDSNATAHFLGFIWNEATWMGRLILWTLNRHGPAPMRRSEIAKAIEAEIQQHELSVESDAFYHEFDDRMDWLEKIADVINPTKKKEYFLCIPLVQRWLQQVMAQEENFLDLALEGLMKDMQQVQP